MSFISHAIDRIIFRTFNLSAESLGIYRICYSLYLLITGIPVFFWINNFPDAFYDPPLFSLASFFTKFPPFWFLMCLSLGTCLFTIFLLFGYRTRLVSLLLAIFILTGKSFSYSFGKIDHDFFLWLIPLIMAFSNWGSAYSIDSRNTIKAENIYGNGWPVTLLALILCLAMFSAGVPKLLVGWLDVSSQAVRGFFLSSFYHHRRQSFLAPMFLNLDSQIIWEMFDYIAVIFELSFIFSLLKPNIFRAFIFFAVIFHVINLVLLNISFTTNCILYLLFIDWNMALRFLRKQKLLTSVPRLINLKNLVIVTIAFFIFFFLVLNQNMKESTFLVSPLRSLLMVLKVNSKLIGAGVIFVTLVICFINVFYFLQQKRINNARVVANT